MSCRPSIPLRTAIILAAACIAPVLLASPAPAQSLQERINNLRQQRAQQEARQRQGIRQRLRAKLENVNLRDVTAREAFEWVSQNGNVPIRINWDRMLQAGIDPEQPVELTAERLSVRATIDMLLSQIAFERKPVMEVTPWFVRVMSREQANQRTVIRTYPVGDLTMRTPNFTNAPEFDLERITEGNSGGGGGTGGGGGGSIFENDDQQDEDDLLAQEGFDPAQRIADLIRQTVEPDLWRANGGLHGTITVFGNNLVVRAPQYVHRRIGGDPGRSASQPRTGAAGPGGNAANPADRTGRPAGQNNDAGIDRAPNRRLGREGQTRDGTAGVERQRPYSGRR